MEEKVNKRKNMALLLIFIILVVIFGGIYFGFKKAKEDKPVEDDNKIVERMTKEYMTAYEKLDFRAILDMMWEDMADDAWEYMHDHFEDLEEEGFEIQKWEIVSIERIKDEDLEPFKEDVIGDYHLKISKLYEVKVKVTQTRAGKTETVENALYFVNTNKDKWYFVN